MQTPKIAVSVIEWSGLKWISSTEGREGTEAFGREKDHRRTPTRILGVHLARYQADHPHNRVSGGTTFKARFFSRLPFSLAFLHPRSANSFKLMAPPANLDPMHIPRACGTTAPSIRTARCKRAFNVASAREEEKRAEETYRKKICRKVISPDTIRKRKRNFFTFGKEKYAGTRVEIFQDFLRYSIAFQICSKSIYRYYDTD